jgi:hypothetical protein
VDALTSRFGTRFFVVTFLPNVFLCGYVGLLVAAGAPARSPSLSRALTALDHLTAYRIVAIVLGVIVVSVAIHPLQVPLIQLAEGYWWGLPFGQELANYATQRFRRELNELRLLNNLPDRKLQRWDERNRASQAQLRKDWLPEDERDLRPTDLGNALWTGETTAGDRYGLDLNLALPRMIPFMPEMVLTELRDRRNQLDASVRLCVLTALATVISVGLLISHGPWLFLAVATYLLTWASYRAAVAAARGFCTILATAVDLNHLKLYDALSLERPANLEDEISRNELLQEFLRGNFLTPGEQKTLRYVTPAVDSKADAKDSAAPPPDSSQDLARP